MKFTDRHFEKKLRTPFKNATWILVTVLTFPVFPAQQIVTNVNEDSSAGSIRAAVIKAAAGDTVGINVPGSDIFPPGDFPIEISKNILINGINAATGNKIVMIGTDRVFRITKGNVLIRDMTIKRAGIECSAGAAAILDGIEVKQCTNGGIYNNGSVSINQCTIDSNRLDYPTQSQSYGAGIFNGGDMFINGSTIHHNILNVHAHVIEDEYWSYNTQALGAGIFNSGRMTVINSTICNDTTQVILSSDASNYATSCGAGISSRNQLTLMYCTICYNFSFYKIGAGGQQGYTYGVGLDISNACTIINSAIVLNYSPIVTSFDNLKPTDVASASQDVFTMNCRIGAGFLGTTKQCDTGAEANRNNFTNAGLSNNSGPTKTFALAANSKAIGAGVRAGFYSVDTAISDNIHTIFKAAYFYGTTWRSVETDSTLPENTVSEIHTDQRGKLRNDPPCIGAFEFTSADPVRRISLHELMSPQVSFCKNNLRLQFQRQDFVHIELFDLFGKKIYSRLLSVDAGAHTIALPPFPAGPIFCRVATSKKCITQKLIKPY